MVGRRVGWADRIPATGILFAVVASLLISSNSDINRSSMGETTCGNHEKTRKKMFRLLVEAGE